MKESTNGKVSTPLPEIYRRHRPRRLADLVGQDQVVASIRSQLANGGLKHAVLLSGPPGVGKTTTARILARRLCGDDKLAVTTINAASARGIDTIREIERDMGYRGWGEKKNRVWILDECHHLTKKAGGDAQTAMLLMLEEPPDHAYFILTTTHPDQLLPTIRQRCTHFQFRKPSDVDMTLLVGRVLEKEKKDLSDKVFQRLVEVAASPRDALVRLGTILDLEEEEAQLALLLPDQTQQDAFDLVRALLWRKKDWEKVRELLVSLEIDDMENFRQLVLVNAAKELLKPKGNYDKANLILQVFGTNWYAEPKTGLFRCCYEILCVS